MPTTPELPERATEGHRAVLASGRGAVSTFLKELRARGERYKAGPDAG
jgi:hypothetical protein